MPALSDQFKYLFYQSYAVGLLPNLNHKTNCFKKSKWMPLFFTNFALISFTYTIIRCLYNLPPVINFNYTTRIFQYILINTIYIQFLIAHHCTKFDKFQLLWETLQRIDNDFCTYFKIIPKELKYIALKLCITNTTYILLHVFYFWSQETIDAGMIFLNEIYVKFALHTTKFIMGHVFSAIRARLEAITNILEKNDDQNLMAAEVFITIHTKCANAIDLCNDLYGPSLALSVVHLVLYALRLVSVLVDKQPIDSYERTLLIMLIMWTIYGSVQAVIVVYMAQRVVDASKVLLATTYKAMNYYNNVPMVRKCLSRLAKQIAARTSEISAAGFFNVDLNMLFNLFNLITTYTVVVVQFSATNSRPCIENKNVSITGY